MMGPPQNTDQPQGAVTVARRYLRRERVASSLVAAAVVAVFLGTYLVSSFLTAVGVGTALLVLVRVPVLKLSGTVRLMTTADPDTVAASFTGATPPVLVFQWGIADAITVENGTPTYHISYLFGLRSITMTVESERVAAADDTRLIELEVTAGDQPWSTYTVQISRRADRTVIEYEYASARRFGLRRLPQRMVAKRVRDAAIEAQGYTVDGRTEQTELTT